MQYLCRHKQLHILQMSHCRWKLFNGKLVPSSSYKVLLSFGEYNCSVKYQVIESLSTNIVLGMFWLEQVNPAIDWNM